MDKVPNEIKDPDLLRIKSKIYLLNNIFKQGTASMILNYFINWMVAVEITNGTDNITIQELFLEIKKRISTLNTIFDEHDFRISSLDSELEDYKEKVENEKNILRDKIYKLFDLCELMENVVKKCVTFGVGLKRILPLMTGYIKPLNILLIDNILTTESNEEFDKKLLEFIADRATGISDPIERKIKKIDLLNRAMRQVIDEPVDYSYYSRNNIPLNDIMLPQKSLPLEAFIELSERLCNKNK